MKYVLDSSVALKWVLTEADSPRANRLRDDFRKNVHELIAPDIFPVEVAHALARAERRKIIVPPQGTAFLTDVLSTPPQLHPYLPLLPRAFTVASRMRVGAYDCLYLALAEQEGCELITADDKMVRNLQAAFPFIVAWASLP
jgi:predicted nucleic acid-binding protein